MKIQKFILFFLIIAFNIYAQDDGPPECMIDCPGLEDIGPDGNPNQICEWIISANGSECMEDCEEEFLIWIEYVSDACDNCLSDENIDCADIFEDDEGLEDECMQFENEDECIAAGCEWGGDDGCYGNWDDEDEDHEDAPPECLLDCEGIEYINPEENPYETCDWIISNFGPNNFINPCAEDCDEETMMDINEYMEVCFQCLADNNCDDVFDDEEEEDDGGWEDFNCEEITNPEECYQVGCEWSTITTPNGVFEMCVNPESNDDGGWNEEGCFENGEWYCYGCEMFINECEYYECTAAMGWVGPFENPECNDNNGDGCSDLGEEACINAPDCVPNYDVAGQFEGCLETDDGPPECLLDCEGIEYVNPEENPYEACDWIISNFGPNNFFNECAYDCDEETMMIINQIAEVCFICLSDENIDCADVWEDGDENSCSDLNQDECDSVDYCEWIADPLNDFYGCVEMGPGDDGGTGGGDGCFESGEWYCYGCEIFINECEYYECTEDGWAGPFVIDDCWIEDECYNLLEDECIGNPNCTWVWDDNPVSNEGYCIEFDDNPPGDDLAILKLEHTTGLPGTVVSVPLILYNLETVAGLQFSIEGYNTPNFPGINVESFESTSDCFSASYNEVNEQLIGIIFSIDGCSYPPSEYNHIANILFYIDETAPVGADVPLWFNYTLVSDTSGNEIPSYGEDSHITLGMQGDVNFDGEINVLDIVAVVNFAIYADEPNGSEFWASDINFDGQINVLDIVQLINIILDI